MLNISEEKLIEFRNTLYSTYSEIGKALAHPVRLIILDLLAQGNSYTVEEVVNETFIPLVSVSQHLQILKRSNLVKVQRQGTYMYYSLENPQIYEILNLIKISSEKTKKEINQTINSYLSHRNKMDEISLTELAEKLKNNSVFLIDLRKPNEYDNGHIEQSISIPYNEFAQSLLEIPKDKEIVVYCRGNYCICSDNALIILKNKGIKSLRLNVGYSEWKAVNNSGT